MECGGVGVAIRLALVRIDARGLVRRIGELRDVRRNNAHVRLRRVVQNASDAVPLERGHLWRNIERRLSSDKVRVERLSHQRMRRPCAEEGGCERKKSVSVFHHERLGADGEDGGSSQEVGCGS
eukprot:scaffold40041_cov33-Tisochrysis_lutea.AAC.1